MDLLLIPGRGTRVLDRTPTEEVRTKSKHVAVQPPVLRDLSSHPLLLPPLPLLPLLAIAVLPLAAAVSRAPLTGRLPREAVRGAVERT